MLRRVVLFQQKHQVTQKNHSLPPSTPILLTTIATLDYRVWRTSGQFKSRLRPRAGKIYLLTLTTKLRSSITTFTITTTSEPKCFNLSYRLTTRPRLALSTWWMLPTRKSYSTHRKILPCNAEMFWQEKRMGLRDSTKRVSIRVSRDKRKSKNNTSWQ